MAQAVCEGWAAALLPARTGAELERGSERAKRGAP